MKSRALPIPEFFQAEQVGEVWRVPYEQRARQAQEWRYTNGISPASTDESKNWLLLVDVQNTFCIPGFELFVGGRSGRGAVVDNTRLCQFIYRNLASITQITATLDTHRAVQVFHPVFFVDEAGNHPAPYTDISASHLQTGMWRFNAALAPELGVAPAYGQQMMIHYAQELERAGKFALTIWPYHAMLGGIGHALVPAVEEALHFHSIARATQTRFEAKGEQPFTEHYSVIGPEVLTGPMGKPLGARSAKFLEQLRECDKLFIAGQAKSHCVAWTISDLQTEILANDPDLAGKVHLLVDCTSPVVVAGAVDHTQAADEAFERFAQAGMHLVRSTEVEL